MHMLKKLVILVVFVAITISACSQQSETRDLSTPEKMLVGHWGKVNSADGSIYENEDMIFGELNEDLEGKLFFRIDSKYYTGPRTYQIKSVEEDTVKFTTKSEGHNIRVTLHLSEDGQFITFDDMAWANRDLWQLKWKYKYIDSQTDPSKE